MGFDPWALGEGERGSVTAEFAVALPAVLVVLGACLGGLAAAGQFILVQDAAAAAAREAGRGDGTSVAGRIAPGAAVSTWSDGELVCVRVSRTAQLGPIGFPLVATACALGGGQ